MKFVPFCLILRLAPALSVTLLPSLTSSVDVVVSSAFLPPSSISDVMENPEELICCFNSSLRFFTSFLTPVNWLTLTASVLALPSATLVIMLLPLSKPVVFKETGFLSVALGVIVIPSALITVVSPAAFLKDALVKSFNFGFKEYVNSLPTCLSFKLLPTFKVTVLPAFTASFVVPSALPESSSPLVTFQAALLIAFTTVSTVAILPVSLSFTFTVPGLDPVVTGSIAPVLTCKPLSPTVIVVPSAFTFTPASDTLMDLSAGFTTIVPSPLVKPLPIFGAALLIISATF